MPRWSHALPVAVLLAALTACTAGGDGGDGDDQSPAGGAGHTHAPGDDHGLPPNGDGTEASLAGYSITDVSLPRRAGEPGEVSFVIEDYDGTPLTRYITEQTKDLHLYVVRSDLGVFRHLHPTMDEQGTWSTRLTLPTPGDYRVVAEFVADDDGGLGDHMVLGETVTVPGDWEPQPVEAPDTGTDGTVQVATEGTPRAGVEDELEVVVADARGRPVRLGTYLGAFAHVTGFHADSGAVVHMHPIGQPEPGSEGSRLRLHTQFAEPGRYVLFVQVRVDDFLHTVPVGVTVAAA